MAMNERSSTRGLIDIISPIISSTKIAKCNVIQ